MTDNAKPARRRRAPEWPDRIAVRRRQRAGRIMLVLALLLVVLPWFALPQLRQAVRDWRAGGAAAAAAAPAAATPRVPVVAAVPAAPARPIAGDADAAAPVVPDADAGAAPAVPARGPLPPLASADHPVARNAARRAAAELPGIRSAGWLDRHRLLAVVGTGSMRQPDVAYRVCATIAAHGDAGAVSVVLQDPSAATAEGRAALTTPCSRMPAARLAGIRMVPVDDDPEAVRARAAPADGDATDAAPATPPAPADDAEALRILRESTPEI